MRQVIAALAILLVPCLIYFLYRKRKKETLDLVNSSLADEVKYARVGAKISMYRIDKVLWQDRGWVIALTRKGGYIISLHGEMKFMGKKEGIIAFLTAQFAVDSVMQIVKHLGWSIDIEEK